MAYMYVWEFIVPRDRAAEFERVYGPEGDWVRLFRAAPGYLRTELYRDCQKPDRFLTIDHWDSRASWELFRSRFATEFEQLDARCAALTGKETEIGRFEAV